MYVNELPPISRLKRPCLGKMAAHGRSNPGTRKIAEIVPSRAMRHPSKRE